MILRTLFIACLVLLQNIACVLCVQAEVEELLVTGSHIPVFADESGSSYTLISQEDIKRRQAIVVSDLLRDVLGLAVSRSGGLGAQTQIRVRGAEANHLLVLIDGVEVNDVTSGEFDFAHLITANIERIEIIRGAQSALYGSDALAGVVNIITKKKEQSYVAYAEAGYFDTVHGGASLSAYEEQYYYDLQTSYLRSGGYNISRHGRENDGYDNVTAALNMGISIGGVKLDLRTRQTQATSEYDGFDLASRLVDADVETDVRQDYWQVQGEFSTYENWQHSLSMASSQTKKDNFANNIKGDVSLGRKLKLHYQSDIHANISSLSDVTYTVTLATEYERDVFLQQRVGDASQKWSLESMGFILGYQMALWQRLFLSTSIRHDENDSFDDAVTYRATAAYNFPDRNLHLHASYGSGIKNPTFSERFATFNIPGIVFFGNAGLKPEEANAWDVGVNKNFLDGRTKMGLSYFQSTLKDEINGFKFVGTEFGTATAVNIDGRSQREGIEAMSSVYLSNDIELAVAYTWLNAEDPDNKREIRRPKNTASLNVTYQSPDRRALIHLNVLYTGEQDDNDFSRGSTVTLDSYSVINITASYDVSDNISINGRFENFFNEQYEEVVGYQTSDRSGFFGFKIIF